MFSSFTSLNASTCLAHRINKSAATLLTAPIKGYSGACPFLRSLSTISNYTTNNNNNNNNTNSNSTDNEQSLADSKSADLFSVNSNEHLRSTSSSSSETTISSTITNHNQQQYEYHQQQQQSLPSPLSATSNVIDYAQHQQQQQYVKPNLDSQIIVENENFKIESKQQQQFEQHESDIQQQQLKIIENTSSSSSSIIYYNYDTKFQELIRRKKDDGSYRIFRRVKRFSSSFPHGTEQERPVTIWCSNDYFGMSSHPKVREAIKRALNEYGAGSGGTRNIAGNSPVHEQLEWELADLHQKQAALLFSSCYVANDSTLYTLLKLIPNCVVFSDAGNHASMIQGIRNSGAKRYIFKAFDADDLEEKLKLEPISRPKIVAFETVHSMTGDISDVERMCDIAHHYGAITFVDEVHAVGLYGERGAGIAQRDNCMDKIDIVSGTLGKAYGNCGGYVAGSTEIIDVVRSYAAGFIFTTSLPPTVACGAIESVKILKGNEGKYLRQLQQNNVFHMKRALTAAGLPHYQSKSHIIPIPVGNAGKCTRVMNDLIQHGHYIQSINYPTVPRGTERLRVSVTPFHSEQMIDSLIESLVPVWKRNNLDFLPSIEVPNQCRRHQMLHNARNTQVGQSLWCHLCHKEMNLCTKKPDERENLVA